MTIPNAIYKGTVTHKRLRPIKHGLSYGVFNLLVDCDEIEQLAKKLKFFSHNKPNIVSLYDKDFGDSKNIKAYLQTLAQKAVPDLSITKFKMLTYPRIFGYAFNPITVYFGLDEAGKTRLMIYEVNNTFGQRHTYVIPAEQREDGMIWQNCDKQFYVSPFNDVSGNYTFHVTPISEKLTVGVALRDDEGPLLNAFFAGQRQELTDSQLIKAIVGTGWMTAKVMLGIHLEALKLWVKGVKLKPRPDAPNSAIEFVKKKTEPAE
ncbi:DUF1365 domain-containing protein [Maritalea porphyrae]|uniref:DUF1365 domain-containing protein n=1 Tax=Maritalea porphyrae TaxID=880732 RepID=UPI0022AF2208|nr:DUF1365 family protein [Maritalea porphyrae]MCZ4273505.1 DUF1365 family protein [Maritalea porphyrae]